MLGLSLPSPTLCGDKNSESSQGLHEASVQTGVHGKGLVHHSAHLLVVRLLVYNVTFCFLIR